MYRKLVIVLLLICVSASLAIAWQPLRAQPGTGLSRPGTSMPAVPASPAPAPTLAVPPLARLTPSCTGTASCFLINSLLPWLLALGLIWGATFHPGRRLPLPLTALKYVAALASAGLAVALLWTEALSMGAGADILSTQTARGPLIAWLASQAPHGVLRILALSLLLAAPLFWLVRGVRLDLPRATFEAWVEVRRLIIPGLALLALAAVAEAYVTPHTVVWLLQ